MTSDTGSSGVRVCLAGLAGAVFGVALFAWKMLEGNGGVPEYPLDDVYIHLAISEQIAAGNYGVNPGHVASAGSSALYPLLLAPLAGTPFHAAAPLVWNLAALGVSAWIFALIIWRAGLTGPLGLLCAFAAPLGLNMAGLAVSGMEHTLHLAVTLATVWGVIRWNDTGRLPGWLWVCVAIGPLLRPEALALSLTVALVVALRGGIARALGLAAVAVAPIALFALFLKSLGLAFLPSSVTAKLELGKVTSDGALAQLLYNIGTPAGTVLLIFVLLILLALLHAQGRAAWPLVALTALPVLAHLFFGQIGWLNRYEGYAISLGAAGVLLLWVPVLRWLVWRAALPVIVIGLAGVTYLPGAIHATRDSARGIYLQQRQMGRFAKDFVQAPVAVNDLGHVSLNNPHYVLDLYGLANREALETRLSAPDPGWAETFVRRHDADLAMLYERWMKDAVSPRWTRLGVLHLSGEFGALGDDSVTFYATRAEAVAPLLAKLAAFVPTLPHGASFEYSTESADG